MKQIFIRLWGFWRLWCEGLLGERHACGAPRRLSEAMGQEQSVGDGIPWDRRATGVGVVLRGLGGSRICI